jgi:hypothetical protein
MFEDDESASVTAISYTDEFVDAAVAKLDGLFGEGYAKANPAALAGYVAACAANLGAFMTAASVMEEEFVSGAIAALDEIQMTPPPRPPARGKRKGGR